MRRRNRDGPAGDPDEKQAQVLKGNFFLLLHNISYITKDLKKKIISGMKDVAKDKKSGSAERDTPGDESSIKAKRWDEALEKPPLDYR